MAVLLITAPSGARLPEGKHTVEVSPRAAASPGARITSSGSTPSRARSWARSRVRRSDDSHSSSCSPRVTPLTVSTRVSRRFARRRCSMTSGTPPARKTWIVGWWRGPLGRASTMRGTRRLTSVQSRAVGRRRPAACAIAGTCRMRFVDPPNAACVTIALWIDASVRMSFIVMPRALESHQCPGGSARHVQPDRVARRRERGVAERHAERLADHLRRRGGAEELAAAPGGRARAATEFRRLLERQFAVDEPHADRLHAARIVSLDGQERDASRHEHARKVVTRGERHHHRGQTLVAGGDAEDAATRRERSNQAAEDGRRVVAIGEAVEHRRRALRAAVARIGAGGGEGDRAGSLELARRGLHEQADFPVPGVVAERDRRAIRRADPAVRRENEELRAADRRRLPAHAGVLRPAEDVAGRPRPQHLRGQRQRTHRTGHVRGDVKE